MDERSNDVNYSEMKAELRALHAKIADLNGRLAAMEAKAPSVRGGAFSKILRYRWPLALGLIALAVGAAAQTGDPIKIGPDGNVTIGKSLGVSGPVKAVRFEGNGSELTVEGHGALKDSLDKFERSLLHLDAAQKAQKASVEQTNRRISGILLTESQTSHLPEFSCGQEQVASTPLTFVVGSRDGTSCGVTNRVYVKTIGLSVPSAQ